MVMLAISSMASRFCCIRSACCTWSSPPLLPAPPLPLFPLLVALPP
jgi:hypothetical protein